MSECAAIVLAAGASARLGQPKQLLQLHGETLLHRSARLALEAGASPVVVVLGFQAAQMRKTLQDLDVLSVVNPKWSTGMGSSLRCGVEAIEKAQPERVLLLLSDQPYLSLGVLQSLLKLSRQSGAPVTAARYADRLGVPAIFHRTLFAELKAITGDTGARLIIARDHQQSPFVDFPEGAFDLDTPEDLTHLRSRS
ncbi:MAG: nucleotidyltransferase family protein [Bacillota bacterium]|jgi:molybdenum cofactor cytidylyltransferase|nr:nucleotidyltransferase family protein [Bacillota bacterium]